MRLGRQASPGPMTIDPKPVFNRAERLILIAALSIAIGWFAILSFRINQDKGFSIDEFQYAHASWLINKGQVPYRDFFEVHFPLVYQYASLYWSFSDDQPSHILQLRLFMLPVLVLCLVGLATAAGERERVLTGLIAVLLAMGCWPFISFSTELRPDPMAFAFFAASIGALHMRKMPHKGAAYLSGVCLGISLWGSQKAWYYATPVFIAWIIDAHAAFRKRSKSGYILRDPKRFALGVMTPWILIAAYLTWTHSWGALYDWCFKWAYAYQQRYPAFSWTRAFVPVIKSYGYYLLIGAIGIISTLRAARKDGQKIEVTSAESSGGLGYVIIASLITAFASFAFQRAPWDYSMIPFLGLIAVFAARGFVMLLVSLRSQMPAHKIAFPLLLLVFILLAFFSHRNSNDFLTRIFVGNSYQLSILDIIGKLTDSSDAVYDNSGSYVSRPHAYFYFYSEKSIRTFDQEMLVREIPRSIERTGTVMIIRDIRYGTLPQALKRYLEENFQKYNGDIWMRGRLFRGDGKFTFNAFKDGVYFILPFDASDRPALMSWDGRDRDIRVDGKLLTNGAVFLTKGEHRISAKDNADGFYLLWLPRDGKPWAPQPNARPLFSRLF